MHIVTSNSTSVTLPHPQPCRTIQDSVWLFQRDHNSHKKHSWDFWIDRGRSLQHCFPKLHKNANQQGMIQLKKRERPPHLYGVTLSDYCMNKVPCRIWLTNTDRFIRNGFTILYKWSCEFLTLTTQEISAQFENHKKSEQWTKTWTLNICKQRQDGSTFTGTWLEKSYNKKLWCWIKRKFDSDTRQ